MATAATATKNTSNKNAAKAVKMVEAGPRGFRFGYAYVTSVVDQAGIAAKESNKQKLVAFAEHIGVQGITMKSDITAALKSMKRAASKFLRENFEVTVH